MNLVWEAIHYAHVRAGHRQRFSYLLGGQGTRRKKQQRMYLGHSEVDAPAENEFLGRGVRVVSDFVRTRISVISIYSEITK